MALWWWGVLILIFMTNMYLTKKNSDLEDAVKAYKKDWQELWDEKETFKREYEHDEELIQFLSKENEELKKKLEKLEQKSVRKSWKTKK